VLLSVFLVCFVALSLTTLLLLIAGHRLRVASRLLGSFCAIVLALGSGEIAASIWRLQTSYVWAGEAFLLFLTLLVVMLRRRWNPLGQVFYGSFLASALAYLTEILHADGSGRPTFMRADGAGATVSRKARMIQQRPLPADVPIVLQVSRWDRLKDPEGVLSAFAAHVEERFKAHLVLAGPETRSVSDDPEDQAVLEACIEAWQACPPRARERIHLACLPMEDLEENGAIVNALQRRADIVVQKSLAEGFGLTVAEAMWKGRPVVASRVGGIQDQIEHARSGLLVDPTDHQDFGRALSGLLEDGDGAARMGREAHRRILDEFLDPRHLVQFGEVLQGILDAPG
jgi:glycosyltransferase involved in cell wall biosynthesis